MHRSSTKSFNPGRQARGFTMIEVIVVIAIMSILASLVGPSIGYCRDAAKRVSCAANFHGWVTGIAMAQADLGYVPVSAFFTPNKWYATEAKAAQRGHQGHITIETMASYVRGVVMPDPADNLTWELTGQWVCPAVCGSGEREAPGWFWRGFYGVAHLNYTYFAGTSYWSTTQLDKTTNPEDFVDRYLDSTKLLMADLIMYRSRVDGWFYNHGEAGSHGLPNPEGHNAWDTDVPGIEGINHLYGDGHVEWINEGALQVNAMIADPDSVRYTGEVRY